MQSDHTGAAYALLAPDRFGWTHAAPPVPAAGEVIVAARYTGLCGTDLHIIEGSHPRARLPLALGHELVGVPETGPLRGQAMLVDPLLPCGGCVACVDGRSNACANLRLIGIDRHGALAGRLAVAEARLHPVPAGVPLQLAPLAEPLAVAVHALGRVGPVTGRTLVVVGGGPVGLLVAHVARRLGAVVLLAERSPVRRGFAEALGLDLLDPMDPVSDLVARTDGRLASVAVDAAAAPPVAALLTQLVHPGGVVAIVGAYGAPVPVDLQAVMFRELTVVGHRTYLPDDIDEGLRVLGADQVALAPLVSEVIGPDGVPAAIEALRSGEVMKVVVECPS